MKIAIPIFNRATFGRCKTVIDKLSSDPYFEVTVVYPAALELEKYGNAAEYLKEDHGKTKYYRLNYAGMVSSSHGACLVSGQIIQTVSEYIEKEKPEAAIITADRLEMLPTTLAFTHHQIPVYHLQAGEVTGALDEKFRHAITMLSDYQIGCTRLATEYIAEMGQDASRVLFSGCPAIEFVKDTGISRDVNDDHKYIILIFHPDTLEPLAEADEHSRVVLDAMKEVCQTQGLECFVYMPNPDPGREVIYERFKAAIRSYPQLFKEAKNEKPEIFLARLAQCAAIVGNSSCGLREAAWLGVPAVNIGDRQGPRERPWNVVDVPINIEKIIDKTKKQIKFGSYKRSYLYSDTKGTASEHILNFIKSHTPSLKGAITYPYWVEYKYRHFDVGRMHGNQRDEKQPNRRKSAFKQRAVRTQGTDEKPKECEANTGEHIQMQS